MAHFVEHPILGFIWDHDLRVLKLMSKWGSELGGKSARDSLSLYIHLLCSSPNSLSLKLDE